MLYLHTPSLVWSPHLYIVWFVLHKKVKWFQWNGFAAAHPHVVTDTLTQNTIMAAKPPHSGTRKTLWLKPWTWAGFCFGFFYYYLFICISVSSSCRFPHHWGVHCSPWWAAWCVLELDLTAEAVNKNNGQTPLLGIAGWLNPVSPRGARSRHPGWWGTPGAEATEQGLSYPWVCGTSLCQGHGPRGGGQGERAPWPGRAAPQLRWGLGQGSAPGSSSMKRLPTAASAKTLSPAWASASGGSCPQSPDHQPASPEMKRGWRVRPARNKVMSFGQCFFYLLLELHAVCSLGSTRRISAREEKKGTEKGLEKS